MRAELDDLLCDRYPQIFRDWHDGAQGAPRKRTFECGDGRFHILDSLCGEIQRHVDSAGTPAVVALRVKEKLGTLRFRYRGGDEYVEGLVWMAEALSGYVCEECGAPASRRTDGGVVTLCRSHSNSPEPGDVPDDDTVTAEAAFRLPALTRNLGWRHIARAVEETLDFAVQNNALPPVVVDEVIETEALTVSRVYGNTRDCVAGMLRLVEVFSLRCDRMTGRTCNVLGT